MKIKIAVLAAVLALIGCQKEVEKEYVTFSGKITNKNSDEIRIYTRDFTKIIEVNEDGTFSDTLKVEKGMYNFYDGAEGTDLFLENGYDLTMELDTKMFDETIKYTGVGEVNNNFLASSALFREEVFDIEWQKLDKQQLKTTVEDVGSKISEFIDSAVDIDTMLIRQYKERMEGSLKAMEGFYGNMIALKEDLPMGADSPEFNDYMNFDGSTTSLSDLRGKYVYIDVWATWCAPCKAEIPYLKEIEVDYHDRNITFVSLSIDEGESGNQKWKKMVADKELGGIQIIAPNDWESDFVKAYRIDGIPRFILIDPEGKVVDPTAPRPSDPELKELLETLI